MSLEPLDRSSPFLCLSPVAVARSSSGDVEVRYILLVLWMTSHLVVVGCMEEFDVHECLVDGVVGAGVDGS